MHHLLEQALTATHHINGVIKDADWESLLLLTKDRQVLLEEYFQFSPLPDSPETIAMAIKTIESVDKKAEELIKASKQAMINESVTLSSGRNAVNSYDQVQAG